MRVQEFTEQQTPHPPDCPCWGCIGRRNHVSWGSALKTGFKWVLIIMAVLAVLFVVVPWAYETWYVATHCTMVLGTRVCQ